MVGSTFKIRSALLVLYQGIAFALIIFWAAWPNQIAVLIGLLFFSGLAAFTFLPVAIKMNGNGISYCGRFKLPWSDVRAVRKVNFLGLPYLLISREHGGSLWLPLYVQGASPIEVAFRKHAPPNNPIFQYADERAGT